MIKQEKNTFPLNISLFLYEVLQKQQETEGFQNTVLMIS